MEKFQNKFRNGTARAPFWEYGWDAAYFITICTHDRKCWFGDVLNGKMILSDIGGIVNHEWLKTFEMRPDMNLMMGEFVLVPNPKIYHPLFGVSKLG